MVKLYTADLYSMILVSIGNKGTPPMLSTPPPFLPMNALPVYFFFFILTISALVFIEERKSYFIFC